MKVRHALIAGLVVLAGCDERFEHITTRKTGGSTLARVADNEIRLPAGRLVIFRVTAHALEGARDYDATDTIELSEIDSSIVRLEEGVRVDTWVAYGEHEGTTELEVRVNGRVEDQIGLEVTPKPEED